MKQVLFDTDVLINRFRGDTRIETEILDLVHAHTRLAYTPVTAAEIYRGLRSPERSKTESLLANLECLEINQAVGERAGDYLRKFAKSHGLEIADALIAAAASIHRFALCTLNWKHYPMNDIDKYRI